MKRIVLCLFVVLSLFFVVGCESKDNKLHIGSLHYDALPNVTKEKEESGTLETGEKWNSVQYVMKDIVLSVMRVEKIHMTTSLGSEYKEKTIQNVSYYYNDSSIVEGYILSEYYTEVGEDTYLISTTYVDNDTNRDILNRFLESVVIKK